MARELPPVERAKRASLIDHPRGQSACGGCIFYESRTDGEGYCAHPALKLDVAASWWCAYHERNESSVKFAGHPLHPAMVSFPLALTAMALIFDVLGLVTKRSHWRREARHALLAGTIGGLLAALAGMMDWLSLPVDRPAKSYGLIHGLGNLLLLGINAANISSRRSSRPASPARRAGEIGLSVAANTLALVTGWLGGELAYRFHVGAEPPSRPHYGAEVNPIARVTEESEWRGGKLQIPQAPIWGGPEIPSQPLPSLPEERRAAS